MDAMISRSSRYGRQQGSSYRDKPILERSLHTFPPDRHSDIVRRPGGLISVPGKLMPASASASATAQANSASRRLTKLLLKVTIERSLGPVQVVMPPENTVGDLVKSAMEIYVREKRRPLLVDNNPHRFELHYSQFSLESLKAEEKLINLGSRNFFLCSKPIASVNSSCSEEANKATHSPFPLTKLMDFLL